MTLLIAAGERAPVDARVLSGVSELDCSLVTGESHPQGVSPGTVLRAGTLNLTAPLTVEAISAAKDSFLAEMTRLMEAAEGGRARYRRIADRASALYSPVVHLTALLTFAGWIWFGGDWHQAITVAIAVLIITCPCALGLAVPIVQVVAARRLFENGVMVKDGSAMERLAEVDTVVFDKTGTLTLGRPRLVNVEDVDPDALEMAAAIAAHSRHPLSMAIAGLGTGKAVALDRVAEMPGLGMEAFLGGARYRLGRAEWALANTAEPHPEGEGATAILARDGWALAELVFEDQLRGDAAGTVAALTASGLHIEMLTGDRSSAAAAVAGKLGLTSFQAGVLPAGKVARIVALAEAGRKVLMVGDGLNDAPALAAAHASMAPASAADVGRNAADFVFLRQSLSAVPLALHVSRRADRLIRQNFALAIGYNFIAVPIAVLGYVTPLIAAIAMSLSSILVIANAMRLNLKAGSGKDASKSRIPVAGGTLVAAE
jgi:Cu2+-exporting ATPase